MVLPEEISVEIRSLKLSVREYNVSIRAPTGKDKDERIVLIDFSANVIKEFPKIIEGDPSRWTDCNVCAPSRNCSYREFIIALEKMTQSSDSWLRGTVVSGYIFGAVIINADNRCKCFADADIAML